MSPAIFVGFMLAWMPFKSKRSVCSAKLAVPGPSFSLPCWTLPLPVNRPAAPKSSSTSLMRMADKSPPSWPRKARSGRRCWSMVPAGPSLTRLTLPEMARLSSSLAATVSVRSAVGSEGLKKPGSMLRAFRSSVRSGIFAKGESVMRASPPARPAFPVASSVVRLRSPPARSFSAAGVAPGPTFACDRLAFAASLNGREAPIWPSAATWPQGVLADRVAQLPLHLVAQQAHAHVGDFGGRALVDEGGLRQARIVERDPERRGERGRHRGRLRRSAFRVSMRRSAACTLLISMPFESSWRGDHSRSMLVTTASCSSVRQTMRSMCIAP